MNAPQRYIFFVRKSRVRRAGSSFYTGVGAISCSAFSPRLPYDPVSDHISGHIFVLPDCIFVSENPIV